MGTRRKCTREFKVEAVKLVVERGVTVAQAARDLDLNVNVLRLWVTAQRADPAYAFPGEGQQKPEAAKLTRLRREVARLKMERDILKKAVVGSTGECNSGLIARIHRRGGDGTDWTPGTIDGKEDGVVGALHGG